MVGLHACELMNVCAHDLAEQFSEQLNGLGANGCRN
jgi:hypothetical protein